MDELKEKIAIKMEPMCKGFGRGEMPMNVAREFAQVALAAIEEAGYRVVLVAEGGLEEVCGEAYQVVGSLLSDLGQFDSDLGQKILDNLSQEQIVHSDVLPWPSFEKPTDRSYAALSEWQPIETAPKDREILLWYPWSSSKRDGMPAGSSYIARWLFSDDGRDRWIDPVDAEDIGEGASHWMPLPSPPAFDPERQFEKDREEGR